MQDIPEKITFLPWECELTNDTLHVMRIEYLDGELGFGTRTGDDEFTFYNSPPLADLKGQKLVVTVFSLEKSTVFEVHFYDTNGFRVLDEHGLTELWSAKDAWQESGLIKARLFKVSGHGWSRESSLSFLSDPFSWMIVTDWDCVEVIAANPPQIVHVKEIAGEAGPVPNDPVDQFFNPPTKH